MWSWHVALADRGLLCSNVQELCVYSALLLLYSLHIAESTESIANTVPHDKQTLCKLPEVTSGKYQFLSSLQYDFVTLIESSEFPFRSIFTESGRCRTYLSQIYYRCRYLGGLYW